MFFLFQKYIPIFSRKKTKCTVYVNKMFGWKSFLFLVIDSKIPPRRLQNRFFKSLHTVYACVSFGKELSVDVFFFVPQKQKRCAPKNVHLCSHLVLNTKTTVL